MRFIHCADLHFDSKLNRYLSSEKSAIRNAELLRTFKNMVDFAKAKGVKVIIIAGDMFDSKTCKASTRKNVSSVIENASDITFLYVRGNHDENTKIFEQKPQNFIEFEKFSEILIDGVYFGGVNYCTDYLNKIYFTHSPAVCILHGSVISGEIDLKSLARKNITYLALGDIHKPMIDKAMDMTWSYSGCLEGRGFDETGERGFNLCEIDGQDVKVTFVPFASRKYHALTVDVSGDYSNFYEKVENAIISSITSRSKEDLYKITLTGYVGESDIIDTALLENSLSRFAFFIKVENETKLKIDLEKYRLEKTSLKSVYIDKVFSSNLSDEDKNKIAMAGILALRGEDISL